MMPDTLKRPPVRNGKSGPIRGVAYREGSSGYIYRQGLLSKNENRGLISGVVSDEGGHI